MHREPVQWFLISCFVCALLTLCLTGTLPTQAAVVMVPPGACENATHCLCRVDNIRMLSLYPLEDGERPVNEKMSCEARPRGARASHRCTCSGGELCVKMGDHYSVQPVGAIDAAALRAAAYWTRECARRYGPAVKPAIT